MHTKTSKLIRVVAVIFFCLLVAAPVLAAPGQPPCSPPDRDQQFTVALDKLVADGTLTRQQGDRVRQFFQSPPPGLVRDLANGAGLSESQAKAVAEALQPPCPPPPPDNRQLNTCLDKLVAGGTLTRQQADRVRQFFQGPPPALVRDLINYAGLSESQAKAVAEALRPPGPPADNRQNPPGSCPTNPAG
jgi:hypothetical protein